MPPVNLLIKPASSLCNMRCRYCFYRDVSENRDTPSFGIMSAATTLAMLENVFTHVQDSVSFAFQGGEPTMAGVDYFRYFHECVEQLNIRRLPVSYSMQTNGYAISDELIALLAKHKYLLGISLDGTQKLHDQLRPDNHGNPTFDTVNETLQRLEAHGVEYNILCVITEQIAKKGAEVYNYFRSRNFRFLQFIPYVPEFGQENESHGYTLSNHRYARFLTTTFRMYYEDMVSGNYFSIRQFDNFVRIAAGQQPECCGMSGHCFVNLVVESDGSVYPCDFYVLDKWRMGNITTDPIPELINSETARVFIETSRPVADACRTCPCLPVCRGGCRRHREIADGSVGLNCYCSAYQTFFRENRTQLLELAHRIRK